MPVPDIGSVKPNTVGMADGMASNTGGTKNTSVLNKASMATDPENMASNTGGEKNMKTFSHAANVVGMSGFAKK
jgi:hypothetical protein